MSEQQLNTCQILSQSEGVSEYRKDFVCLNDSLHENLQDHPHVLFLKMVTRKSPGPKSDS